VSAPSTNPLRFMTGALHGGRSELRTATMVDLIGSAYGVDADKVIGGPNWLESDRYDVIVKAPGSASPEALKLMLQALLADRFNLAVHNDSKPLPGFALTLGKRKPQLKEADGTGETGCRGLPQTPAPGTIPPAVVSCNNVTMAAFAEQLRRMASAYIDHSIVDLTGLKGSWDFTLKWTARAALGFAGAEGITIFDAVDKQLGLRLEPQKVQTPVLVVDLVNRKPTDNLPDVAQSLPAVAVPTEFEVADIKPSNPDSKEQGLRIQPGGRVAVQGMTLKFLITLA
jgi:uncharacterized protein (TIGR03435 family)